MVLHYEKFYIRFLKLTRKLSNTQVLALLAIVVGVLAGFGTYLFEELLHGIFGIRVVICQLPRITKQFVAEWKNGYFELF